MIFEVASCLRQALPTALVAAIPGILTFSTLLCVHIGFQGRRATEDSIPLLSVRLSAYAEMHMKDNERKGSYRDWMKRSSPSDRMLLSDGEHRVLLGTLKKIEAKNAVLTALTLPWFVLSVGALLNANLSLNADERSVLSGILAYIVYLSMTRLDGNNHLSQSSFLENYRISTCKKNMQFECYPNSLPIRMQRDLMLNLLDKERAFYAGYSGLMIVVISLAIFAAIAVISP